MPDANDTLDELDGLDDSDPTLVARLREFAKRADGRAREAEQVRRENAFLRAGIDLDSRLGKMFAQTYSGKLDDVEAIRAEAREIDPRIIADATPPSEPASGEQATTQPEQQVTGSQERQALAEGISSPTTAGDPRAESLAAARKALDEGAEWDKAAGHMVAERARAVHEGRLAPLTSTGRRQ